MKTLAPRTAARAALALLLPLALAGCGSKTAAIKSFTATPSEVTNGDPVTLTWETTDAESLSIDGGVGDVTGKTSVTVTPSDSVTYTLTATSSGGSATKTAAVTVKPKLPPSKILRFTADPVQVAPGADVTLSWSLAGTPAINIDHGVGALSASSTSVVVKPTATTVYTLSVKGASDPVPVTATVRVLVSPLPTITFFRAQAPGTSTGAPRGAALTLEWDSNGDSYAIAAGSASSTALGPLKSTVVRPLADTTYTLTATGPTGSTTRQLAVTVSGAAGSKLVYTDPPAGAEAVRLVKDASSTDAVVVLNLVLGTAASGLTGLALDLPLDGASPGSRDGIARVVLDDATPALPGAEWHTVAPGLDVGGVIPVWAAGSTAATVAAMAKIPLSGPLKGVLALGFALKPAAACTANAATCLGTSATSGGGAAGAVLGRVRLKLVPGGGTGRVFDALKGTGARAELRDASGGKATSFAVGTLDVQ